MSNNVFVTFDWDWLLKFMENWGRTSSSCFQWLSKNLRLLHILENWDQPSSTLAFGRHSRLRSAIVNQLLEVFKHRWMLNNRDNLMSTIVHINYCLNTLWLVLTLDILVGRRQTASGEFLNTSEFWTAQKTDVHNRQRWFSWIYDYCLHFSKSMKIVIGHHQTALQKSVYCETSKQLGSSSGTL